MDFIIDGNIQRLKELYESVSKDTHIKHNMIIGCSECPFPTKVRDINIADPDEGYYLCPLLGKEVWGENPECNHNVFQLMARALLHYEMG